jgi:hypothetical protein
MDGRDKMPTFRSNIITTVTGTAAPILTAQSHTVANQIINFGLMDGNVHLIAWRTGSALTAITGGTMDIYGYYAKIPGWVKLDHLTHADFLASRVKDIPLDSNILGYDKLCFKQRTGAKLKLEIVADARKAQFKSGGSIY